MSIGLMCDCDLPPMKGLTAADEGHSERLGGLPGCPQYSADQEKGGPCPFCADAHAMPLPANKALDAPWSDANGDEVERGEPDPIPSLAADTPK